MLVRQVKIDKVRSCVRDQLSDLVSDGEERGFLKIQKAFDESFNALLQDKFQVLNRGILVSSGLFSGESIETAKLVGYLDEPSQGYL
jgi:hypothetical protein